MARFNQPAGLTLDTLGNLYVADSFNSTIRRIALSSNTVSTFAGSPTGIGTTDGPTISALFRQPMDLTWAGNGALFISDYGNYTIRKIDINTNTVTTIAGSPKTFGEADGTGPSASFNNARSLRYYQGSLYVADSGNNMIRKLTVATQAVSTIAGTPTHSGSDDGVGTAARFASPGGIVSYVDNTGATILFVADTYYSVIRRISLGTGTVTTFAGTVGGRENVDGTGPAAKFNQPYGIAADSDSLYVADSGNHTIRRINIASQAVTTLAGNATIPGATDGTGSAASFDNPRGVAADGSGKLYVADTSNHTIRSIVISSGVVTTVAGKAMTLGNADGTGSAARFNYPLALASDTFGKLYVADTSNHTIRGIDPTTGVVTTIAGSPGVPGTTDGTAATSLFSYPQALVADGFGNLFVADGSSTLRVLRLATGKVFTAMGVPGVQAIRPGPAPALLNASAGITITKSGNPVISDRSENSILLVRISAF